eukprot:gene14827-17180_t
MSQSGKVMSWAMKESRKTGHKYAYGFAVTKSGQTWEDWKGNEKGKAMAMKAKEEWQAHKESQDGWTKRERPAGGGARGRGGPEKRT